MTILDELNLNPEGLRWQDLATCQYLPDETHPLRLFYEDYQASPEVRAVVGEMCASCPVRDACYDHGRMNKESGVWGGVYLEDGKEK